MAENMFLADRRMQSEDVFSSVTQIPSIADTGKEPIQAQSQSVKSTARKEPIQSQSNSSVQSNGILKRDKASACVTLSVDEKGREILICNYCQNVIHVGGERASCKKVTSEVCFTILEEEEEEIPLRNVKARIVKEGEGSCKEPVGGIDEECLSEREKELLDTAKEALREFFRGPKPIPKSK